MSKKLCPYGGKTQFTTERQAKIARETITKRGGKKGIRVYKCPNCHLFHFTSAKK